jgi:hypothetical protein
MSSFKFKKQPISELRKRIVTCSGSARLSKKNTERENLDLFEKMMANKHRMWIGEDITTNQSISLSKWITAQYEKTLVK